jgi:hypothetical protein
MRQQSIQSSLRELCLPLSLTLTPFFYRDEQASNTISEAGEAVAPFPDTPTSASRFGSIK